MTPSYLAILAAILLPVLPGRWGYFLGAVAGSILLLILAFTLCTDAPQGYQNPWHALGCVIIVAVGSIIAVASMGLGAYRIAGRARGWKSAQFPEIMVPAMMIYLGAGFFLWAFVAAHRY